MSAYFHVPPAAPPASPPLVARGDGEPRRTRLPSLPASLVPSPPASPAPAHASILIFPVPSSAPPSPAPSTPPSHASLPVSSPLSLPISLVSSRHHPHSRGHHHPSLADDPEWISLARDQAVQRTRMAFEPWMETEPSSPGVDLWSWSGGDSRASANPSASMTPASRSSLVLHDETPSEQWEGDTQYEDALSQLQFSTISASTTHPSESQFIFDSLLFPTFNSPTPNPKTRSLLPPRKNKHSISRSNLFSGLSSPSTRTRSSCSNVRPSDGLRTPISSLSSFQNPDAMQTPPLHWINMLRAQKNARSRAGILPGYCPEDSMLLMPAPVLASAPAQIPTPTIAIRSGKASPPAPRWKTLIPSS
ncbi:hypothetical protein BOTBODRAFT_177559 [Botryobasidium botryosum FD-172 SS1]|uniref:Uncharacterized protein n=1 Tax=Botryobasidium botryosum (strain FD-172 SS1) TaxID=930990 RepID=A0A067MGR0_BOTB1|nr:hypothetical protein BOTBODRAFT_177559 [Botryobasidium botryosum FD-172 SS1]